ncbi:hypothetical protein [Bradyrhizobium roseum]|uniref:hypothetical protein n=1 Tax=Bradyrhizobium roseum TaxID=3056648 RepID=UPI002609BF45|nr:hypothetical protein [Bradyrhizobium roseus]WKA31156.1 hypothetical protein QUH67_13735 [Bradyrhizobium roseus]
MTKDFIAICAATLTIGVGMWGLRGHPPGASPQTTETLRLLADDPALKIASERSPYMRNER